MVTASFGLNRAEVEIRARRVSRTYGRTVRRTEANVAAKRSRTPTNQEEPVMAALPSGDREWRLNGQLHRVPGFAVEYAEGGGEVWSHGKHLFTLPATAPSGWRKVRGEPVVTQLPDGSREWRVEGKLHREDGPAVTYGDGGASWWLHGINHREEGPAAVFADGSRAWYQNGRLHRLDGPALEQPDGRMGWFRGGLPHRKDGPAFVDPILGDLWALDGELFTTEEEFREALARRPGKP